MKEDNFVAKLVDKIAKRKRSKSDLVLSFICLILSLGILLSSVTYSWIRRNWSSTIKEAQLKIESNGSLAFQVDSEKSEYTNSISLLAQIGDYHFTLKPVSNLTGKSDDFFYLNKDVSGGETFAHIPMAATPKERMETGKQYGYVEFYFKILGESVTEGEAVTTTKFVYLDSNSFFEGFDAASESAAYAVRVSITAKDSAGKESTILFKNPDPNNFTHTAINNTKKDGKWIADGAQYWDGVGNEAHNLIVNGEQLLENSEPIDLTLSAADVNVKVKQFSDYFGGITSETDENSVTRRYIDEKKCICSFSSNDSEDIVVRIWIEGTDPHCDDTIAGCKLSLLLSFAAVNCEKVNDRFVIVEHNT